MNLYKSARIGEAELKKEVQNVQKYTKDISPSSTQTANLIFDEMQHKCSLTTSTTIKSNHDYTKSTNTLSDDFSTFGLVKRGLRIANLNICHILNKIDEIKLLLSEKRSVDILGVCETFLNSDVPDELITADGFNFERKDREGKIRRGYISIYIAIIKLQTTFRFRRGNRNHMA